MSKSVTVHSATWSGSLNISVPKSIDIHCLLAAGVSGSCNQVFSSYSQHQSSITTERIQHLNNETYYLCPFFFHNLWEGLSYPSRRPIRTRNLLSSIPYYCSHKIIENLNSRTVTFFPFQLHKGIFGFHQVKTLYNSEQYIKVLVPNLFISFFFLLFKL
jgi:ABC-type polysaccharide transport system permease subunit